MNVLFRKFLARIVSKGSLVVTDADGKAHRFGDGTGEPVHIRFRTRAAERAVFLYPQLKAGECYMDGDLEMVEGTVYDLLSLVFSNAGPTITGATPWLRLLDRLRRLAAGFARGNTTRRSRDNVRHHYDLSGELYELFLDRDRQYSCAYFESPAASLDEAQHAKKRHIAAKMVMDRPGLSVLDIGSGWGGMGLYLARHLEAEVTGVTLSQEQYTVSNARARSQGLQSAASFQLKDYRELDRTFDRIVSVGMFEHVGRRHYDAFFARAADLLDRDGVMLLHTIGQASVPSPTNPFIARYIFPGGYIPSLSEIMPHVERAGLYVTDIEVLRLHYAETLRHWRERFVARWDEARALYDERFCRMWEFYLAASESAFRWQQLVVFQLQIAHRQDAVPLTRDYIGEAEERLRRLDTTDDLAAARRRNEQSRAS